jgi:tRNA(Ile)-lysidine synthase
MAILAEHAREDEAFLDEAAAAKLAGSLQEREGAWSIPFHDLVARTTPPSLRGRIVRRIVKACKGRGGELGAQHVASVLELAERGESGKQLRLPGDVEVRRERDAMLFRAVTANQSAQQAVIDYEYEVAQSAPGVTIRLAPLRCAFRFTTIDWPCQRSETIMRKRAFADCSKLRGSLLLRNWRPGDRFQPAGRKSVHKLKRLLNESGVNRWERNGWPVLTSAGEVVWARGFGVSASCSTDVATKRVLLIEEETL